MICSAGTGRIDCSFSVHALPFICRHGIMNRLEIQQHIRKDKRIMPDEVWLQHWLERRTVGQNEEKDEIANMDSTDYAVMLEELEYK